MLVYHPLDVEKNEIRLLELTKPTSSKSKDELIACNLRHVSLNDYTDEYANFYDTYKGARSSMSLALSWLAMKGEIPNIAHLKGTAYQDSLWEDIPVEVLEKSTVQPPSEGFPSRYKWGDFAALSYVWGDPKYTAEIVVNGEKVSVTKNLESALRGICTWWFEDDSGNTDLEYIWVDALCINQNDLSERNAQVKRMGDVYRSAAVVFVWVGTSFDSQKETKKLLEQIENEMSENRMTTESFTSRLNVENAKGWQGLNELSMRPYWKRLWIIQEVLLANTTALICYGEQYSSLNIFFAAIGHLSQNANKWADMWPLALEGSASERPTSLLLDPHGMIDLHHLIGLMSYKSSNQPRPDLMHLLHAAARAEQTDARDKVYGIMGLLDTAISDLIVTDYEKPVTQIYQEFVFTVIQVTGKLDIIYQRRMGIASETYRPSWVPDWCSTFEYDKDLSRSEENSDFIAPYHLRNFKTAGDTIHVFREAEDSSSLICRGFQYDTVDGLTCGIQAHVQHGKHETVTKKSESPSHRVHDTIIDIKNMFWDTLLIGGHKNYKPEDLLKLQQIPLLTEEFDELDEEDDVFFYGILARFQQCNKDFDISGHSLGSCFDEMTDSDEQEAIFNDSSGSFNGLLGFIQTNILWRRLATTEKGYLVLAPRTVQQGDEIYILKGCNVPLVLRHNDDGSHTLVGECYIQNLMNGEALEFQQKYGVEDVTVILR